MYRKTHDKIRVAADLTTSNPAEAGSDLETTVLGTQNNTSDETNGVNNAVSCYKEAVQFSASFVMSLFASFKRNL